MTQPAMAEHQWLRSGRLSSGRSLQLEARLLPSWRRHHLRLLAHKLALPQAIAGPAPGRDNGSSQQQTGILAGQARDSL